MPPDKPVKSSSLVDAILRGGVIDDEEVKRITGSFRDTSETIKKSKTGVKVAEAEATKAQPGVMSFLKSIPAGIGQTFAHPIESGKRLFEAAPDIASGVAVGAANVVPYYNPEKKALQWGDLGQQLERQAFITGASENGMDTDSAESLWESYITPERKDARGVGEFLSYMIPAAAGEKIFAKGLQFAAPKFVANHGTAAKIMTYAFGNVAAGQVVAGPDATAKDRLIQAPIDAALGAAIPMIGPAWSAARRAIFRPVTGTRLATGAIEPAILSETKGIKRGEVPTATVTAKDGDFSVSTNNVEAVQNYLKASGKTNIVIESKAPQSLGITREGLPVTARHTFNPKTGVHTMYVSSAADAQTIAHEWGHYIDDSVAKEVRGLSRYLFGEATEVKNVGAIEDTLRSLAVKDLADAGSTTISPGMIDTKMGEIIAAIRSEARQLAKQRPDPRALTGEKKFSEQLADAVSVALTGPAAMRKGAFFRFLQEANAVDPELVKALRAQGRAEKVVERTGERTGLQRAVERQKQATDEKLGLGDRAPERAQRPPNRKYEQSRSEREEIAFKDVPQQIVGRSENQIQQALLKAKVPGKNTVQVQVNGKNPVTLVVHEIDGTILRAIQAGADSKYMQYAVRAVMKEFGMSKRGAEAYISKRFKELKTFAENKAQEGQFVMVKAVRGKGEAPKVEQQSLSLKEKTADDVAAEKAARADTEAKAEAEANVLTEMELAEAGRRDVLDYGIDRNVIGVPSTFPKWVPENLRSKELFDKVIEHYENGTTPAANATRQNELLALMKSEIEARTGRYKEGAMAESENIRIQEEMALERERMAAEDEYFASSQLDEGGAARTLATEEAQPLKLDLDRMDTGKKPKTEPFRAEKMTDYMDEEVFLNTKVLPEITGKERISRSNADIVRQATDSGMTEEGFLNILKERVGALTPDVRKGFEIAMQKADELRTLLGNRTASELSPDELLMFKEKLGQTVQLFEVYSGIRTEASNLLRSFGIAYSRGEDDVLRQIFEDLQKAGIASEKDVFRAMANTYKQITTNTKFDKYMKGLYAAWLSGPATTLRNIFGSLGNITSEILSKGANPKTMKELPTAVANIFRDFTEKGLPDARNVLKGETSVGNKFATFDPSFPLPQDAFAASQKSMYDRVTESVGRWLNAQDIALARTVQEMEKRSLRVYRPDISDDVAKAISDQYGLSSVYRGIPKGRAIRGLVMGAETLTREWPQAKLLIPFIRTIGNVLDRQFDYMPVFSLLRSRDGVLLEQARTIAKKYGIKKEDDIRLILGRLKDQQMGRAYVGMAVSAAAAVAASNGMISGNGPKNYNERLQLERTGWRRNSIKIGDTWVPYTYIGPLAGILSLMGNIHDAVEYENASDKNIAEMFANGMVGWLNTQLNMSFLKGTADLIDVLVGNADPIRYFNNLGASLVPVPAFYSQTLNMSKNIYSHIVDDPSLRQQYETRNIVDSLRLKLGLTGKFLGLPALNPRTDMFGEPLTLDLIYGLTPTADKRNKMPVDNLLLNSGVVITIPSRSTKYTIRGEEVKLDDKQYPKYVQTSGQYIYEQLQREYQSLNRMTQEELQNRVEEIVRTSRARARIDLFR